MALTDEAIEKIRAMIASGALRPGDRLPSEAELGAQLGLSRSSLREAVKALSLINVLDVRRGDGTFVTSLDPVLLVDAMAFAADFRRDRSVLHLLDVRAILEPAATALAATAMSDEAIAGLGALLDEPELDTGLEFHRRIARGSGNPVLASLLDGLAGRTPAEQRAAGEHRAIVAALAARRPDVARAHAIVHLAELRRWLAGDG